MVPPAVSTAADVIDDIADLIKLEEENKQLRKELSEKLRAENADLRKRLGKAARERGFGIRCPP